MSPVHTSSCTAIKNIVFGDAGYHGRHKRPEADPAHEFHWRMAMKSGKRRQLEREQPLDIARQASALWHAMGGVPDDTPVARFLASHPEHRTIVRRVHILVDMPYAEIRDNLISENLLPIDLLRCKLAFFGATRFDPRSDRWLRISLFQGAPYPDELCREATQ